MVVKLKLQRKGTKNRPCYRLVVQPDRTALEGSVIEILGQYDPLKKSELLNVDAEKVKAWLAKGAQPTDKVRILLGKAGVLPAVDVAALPKKKAKLHKEEQPCES
ncbi:MAG: 30S ribosomal protein S16 [Candidatus Margulisbacteria bacterium]|nr:30S ribosomal protein S16 [Candidatus Margulisiibacteriota bacterium]